MGVAGPTVADRATGGANEMTSLPPPRHYDVEVAKMCSWLKAHGLVMHCPRKGVPYVTKKVVEKKRFIDYGN